MLPHILQMNLPYTIINDSATDAANLLSWRFMSCERELSSGHLSAQPGLSLLVLTFPVTSLLRS